MNKKEIQDRFTKWKNYLTESDLLYKLTKLSDNQINDAFYRDLEFGIGGLCGIIGVGTNRINIYVVAKATQCLSDYINSKYEKVDQLVAISRDSRI